MMNRRKGLLVLGLAVGVLTGCQGAKSEFEGEWFSSDYFCPGTGSNLRESIHITQDKNYIYARKLSGDPCVPEGFVTFYGSVDGELICVGGSASQPASLHFRQKLTKNDDGSFNVCNLHIKRP